MIKNILLLGLIFLFVGCSSKIKPEERIVIKDNYIFLNKCDIELKEELLKIEKIKIIEGNNEEEIKKFILDLYKLNKDNERKIKTIKGVYDLYKICVKESYSLNTDKK